MSNIVIMNASTFEVETASDSSSGNVSIFEVVLSGLEEYVNYSIRVRAYTSEDPGPYSDVIYETTLQDRKST